LALAFAAGWTPLQRLLNAKVVTPTLVVLPFVDLSADKADQPFCDGLTEEMSAGLSEMPSLTIIARASAFAYRDKAKDVRVIGRELNATHVLSGTLRRDGEFLRIRVELADTADGHVLWQTPFNRPLRDAIQLQDEIAEAVAENLQLRLGTNRREWFANRISKDDQAYNLYLLGKQQLQLRTRESNDRAISLMERAVALDPAFALARIYLAQAYIGASYQSGKTIAQISPLAEAQLEVAARSSPNSPELFSVRGLLELEQSRLESAQTDLQRAVELNPNDSVALTNLGRLQYQTARPGEALRSLNRAAYLNPLDAYIEWRRCAVLTDMTQYGEAEEACRRSRALQPTLPWSLYATAALEESRGNLAAAIDWNKQTMNLVPHYVSLYSRLVRLYTQIGDFDAAEAFLEQGRALGEYSEATDTALDFVQEDLALARGGMAGVRKLLAEKNWEQSGMADRLLLAAEVRLILGEPERAAALVKKARNAADYSQASMIDPWRLRRGYAPSTLVAAIDMAQGDVASAVAGVTALRARLNAIRAAGVSSPLTFELEAFTFAIEKQPGLAMNALRRATELGWRRDRWAQVGPYLEPLRERPDFKALMNEISKRNAQERARLQRL
jgi:TolB-like protein/Tfp pilus assembly protein PilF